MKIRDKKQAVVDVTTNEKKVRQNYFSGRLIIFFKNLIHHVVFTIRIRSIYAIPKYLTENTTVITSVQKVDKPTILWTVTTGYT